MDVKFSSSSVSGPQQASSQDELFMQQSLLFSNTLKELKNLRKQLYSAAEYFELSYSKEEHQKQIVVETLKEYTIKALVNTVDHLGSVAYKVDRFLDKKIGDVSAVDLRISCIEQRLKTCQDYINQGGRHQQSLLIMTPKHHKQYIFPVETTRDAVGINQSTYHPRSFNADDNLHQFQYAVKATIQVIPRSYFREGHSALQSPQFSLGQGNFTFTRNSINTKPEKLTASPHRFAFIRSVSVHKRSTSPNSANAVRRYPSEPRRSVSLSMFSERESPNDIEQYSSKSKRLFKALLSMRKPRKEGTLYKYLDEN